MPRSSRVPTPNVDLYLVRHAIAEPRDSVRWPDDAVRPLTPEGVARFRSAARGLRVLGVEVDAVLSSSWARAWATAELLTEETGWPLAAACPELQPPSSPVAALEVLRERSESSLAVVGHDPHLSELGSLLLTGSEHSVRIDLKKGGVLCLRLGSAREAGAVLCWSATPRLLRALDPSSS